MFNWSTTMAESVMMSPQRATISSGAKAETTFCKSTKAEMQEPVVGIHAGIGVGCGVGVGCEYGGEVGLFSPVGCMVGVGCEYGGGVGLFLLFRLIMPPIPSFFFEALGLPLIMPPVIALPILSPVRARTVIGSVTAKSRTAFIVLETYRRLRIQWNDSDRRFAFFECFRTLITYKPKRKTGPLVLY
jgi:hypothetical protein